MNVAIIGLGVGGLYASKYASGANRKANVTIIEKRDFDQFSPCGLPYAIEGVVKDFADLQYSIPETGRLKKLLSHEVQSVDVTGKKLKAKNLKTGEIIELTWDTLVLATGADPTNLPIPGAEEFIGKGVHFCTNPSNAMALRDAALKSKNKAVCVVGGGATGLEVAAALKVLGLDVHITKRTPPVMADLFDPEMGALVINKLAELGIHQYFGKGIESVNGTDCVESVTIAGQVIPCDMVVMAVGMRARIYLAEGNDIIANKNGFVTNERMETNVPGVFAVGDCAESFSRLDGTKGPALLATTAYRQGAIAGINATGGDAKYKGFYNTFVSFVGDMEMAATGLNMEAAQKAGHGNVKAISVKGAIRPHYIANNSELSLRLVVDGDTGKILGGQAIGKEGAAWRINVIGIMASKGMTIFDLQDTEFAYCPPVSDVFDLLSRAADIAVKRISR
ncbi:MAG: FAD-dependent oxidoreductase [Thermoplasmata archaeon]|nr:FAD-dependent oxidoreductase [Thermoplasmata archaeon]